MQPKLVLIVLVPNIKVAFAIQDVADLCQKGNDLEAAKQSLSFPPHHCSRKLTLIFMDMLLEEDLDFLVIFWQFALGNVAHIVVRVSSDLPDGLQLGVVIANARVQLPGLTKGVQSPFRKGASVHGIAGW